MSGTIVALDCMGGDFAPLEIVKGGVRAICENPDIIVKFVGRREEIETCLSGYELLSEQKSHMEVIDAPDVIEMGESPVTAIREKTESSLVRCLYLVKRGEADAMVSAGSTGANLVGGHTIIGRLKGVQRPPLAPVIPTKKGVTLLLDCGANVDAKPSNLVQFAQMGSVYMQHIIGIQNPKVGLVNIGTEEEKGNALTKETYQLFKELSGINFIGNIEARDIPKGVADVVVCDAFVGNVILKTYEGVAGTLMGKVKESLTSNCKTKLGALLIKNSLKETLKSFDVEEYGGAPLLGLKGLLIKTHGNSTAVEIKNSILQCAMFHKLDINNKFKEKLSL